ncbi:hypothetical protein, partial [Anoxybacillus ayderensis]|uniref:hypothetical protein n=1 Tax=Anoxybacillus ayderensis TaxID=265546 RepID=UPI001F3D6833
CESRTLPGIIVFIEKIYFYFNHRGVEHERIHILEITSAYRSSCYLIKLTESGTANSFNVFH